MLDIFFSNSHGFELNTPFIHLWISSAAVYLTALGVIALRVRKIILTRRGVR